MSLKPKTFTTVLLLAWLPMTAPAIEPVTDSEAMIKGLLVPNQPVEPPTLGRTRLIGNTLGLPSGEPAQTRAIKVRVRAEDGAMAETTSDRLPEIAASIHLLVHFDTNSYVIQTEMMPLLDQLGIALSDPRLGVSTILIAGHTNADGPDDYNLTLSYNRAQSVRGYLLANHRIPPERIRIAGFGEGDPVASNLTADGKQQNRRVEISRLRL